MTTEETDVAIIGAGPNGVAVAAQLEASGIERRIFGFPFATWRDRMPEGMLLRSDLDRLDFISSELRSSLKRAGGVPALSRSFESSVPGLFFVGSPAAPSLGPSMRFISGTRFTARRLARRMKAGKGRADVGAEAPQRK